MARVKLKNYGGEISSGLDSFEKAFGLAQKVMQAKKQAEITDATEKGMAAAEAEAANSGGTGFEAEGYRAAQGLTQEGTEQSETLRRQDEEFGKDALSAAKMTREGLDSAYQGRSRDEAIAHQQRINDVLAKNPSASGYAAQRAVAIQEGLPPNAPSDPGHLGAAPGSNPNGVVTAKIDPQQDITVSALDKGSTVADQTRPDFLTAGRYRDRITGAQPALSEMSPASSQGFKPAEAPMAPQAGLPQRPTLESVAIQKPKYDAMELFHKKYAPAIAQKMIKNGDIAGAKAFSDWSKSEKGAAYNEKWMGAMLKFRSGDKQGAMADLTSLYNAQVPDGQIATVRQGQKEGEYIVEFRDEKTNQVVGKPIVGKEDDLLMMGLGASAPDKAFSYLEGKNAAAVKRDQELEDYEARKKIDQKYARREITDRTGKLDGNTAAALIKAGVPEAKIKSLMGRNVIVGYDKETQAPVALYMEKEQTPMWTAVVSSQIARQNQQDKRADRASEQAASKARADELDRQIADAEAALVTAKNGSKDRTGATYVNQKDVASRSAALNKLRLDRASIP